MRVCSGQIPHHKCCSIYVICRVQIAFHTTRLHIALNVFSSPIIPSHNSKRFYFTPTFTSHHSTPHHSTSHHHCTTFHITLLHTTCSTPHLGHLMLQQSHLGPPYSTSDITLHRSLPHTTISHYHISKHMFHITQPQSPSRTTIPHHTHIQHHSTFHTTPYSTSHYTTTS